VFESSHPFDFFGYFRVPYAVRPGPAASRGTVPRCPVPQDHTMFSILQSPDADVWRRKAQLFRGRRAMLLALTQPDYAHGFQPGR
jgi:hypothetical protein